MQIPWSQWAEGKWSLSEYPPMKKDRISFGNLLQTIMTLGLGYILNGQTLQTLPSACMSVSPAMTTRRRKVGGNIGPYSAAAGLWWGKNGGSSDVSQPYASSFTLHGQRSLSSLPQWDLELKRWWERPASYRGLVPEHDMFRMPRRSVWPFIFCLLSTILLPALCVEKLNVQGHFEKFQRSKQEILPVLEFI